MNLYDFFYLLQTTNGGGTPGGETPTGPGPSGSGSFLLIMLGMIVIFYFLMIRPQMKEQKRRKEMLGSIKKHDRVITNGGIHGVVVSVGDTDVVLKIDESNNVRVKFARSAIGSISRDEPSDDAK